MAEPTPTPTSMSFASGQHDAVVSVRDLEVEFPTQVGVVNALNGVSFGITRSKVLGIVGESGSGKSVTARAMMQLIEPPGQITGGEILFRPPDTEQTGQLHLDPGTDQLDLAQLDPHEETIRAIRGQHVSMIFQEPMTSLNPVYTVGSQIEEAVLLHQTADRDEAHNRAVEMLARVGMPNPEQVTSHYPHQLSGGMRQRAMIAMALSCAPTLLIADEPTTALDVTTEAQILQLMRELQSDLGMSIMFITHNMGVVAQLCDEVVVMYLGRVVEHAPVEEIFYEPKHPYTISLLRSIPHIGQTRGAPLEVIRGNMPDPHATVPGCSFHPRCPVAIDGLCDTVVPLEAPMPDTPNHTVRCHLYPGSTPNESIAAEGGSR